MQPIYAQPVFPSSVSNQPADRPPSSGARLVASDGRELPLEGTQLKSEAGGGIARSVLTQRFVNRHAEALRVTYLLPLPSDGAVSGFCFRINDETTRGVVMPVQAARDRFEEALIEGRSAALLEQTRTSVFSQELGNIPPGAAVDIEVSVDHPLAFVGGGWEFRFPTVIAPRYQSGAQAASPLNLAIHADGAAPNGEPVGPAALLAKSQLELLIVEELSHPSDSAARPTSPSHTVAFESVGRATRVNIADAALDRDLVVRWPVSQHEPGLRLEVSRGTAGPQAERAYGLLSLVPPAVATQAVPRDLIVLLDTSGSMGGEPLEQAVALVSALVSSLGPADQLELVEFSSQVRHWQQRAVCATEEHKLRALRWLAGLRASGGTEMKSGIDAALASLRGGAQRQIVLVSDGLIGFEQEILQALEQRLPENCRFHAVGVGHGVNRSLTQPAARAGRGVEVILTAGEHVEAARARLLAGTAQPQIVNLRLSGSALLGAPARPRDVYAGCPALIPLMLRAEGGTLFIHGDTLNGEYRQQLSVAAAPLGQGSARVAALYARDQVEDAELEFAAYPKRREQLNRYIEGLGVDYQLATRLTAWVAVTDAPTVDPQAPGRTLEQSHQLAAGLSAESVGLRASNEGAFGGGGRNVNKTSRQRPRLEAYAGAPPPAQSPAPFRAVPPMPDRPASSPPGFGAPPAPGAPPPAAPALGAPKSRSLLRRVADWATGGSREEREQDGAAGPVAASAHETDETAHKADAATLRGKLRLLSASRLVLSVLVDSELEWLLPEWVELELADGSRLKVSVEAAYSSGSGTIAARQELRLVLALSGELAHTPVRVWVTEAGAEQGTPRQWSIEL